MRIEEYLDSLEKKELIYIFLSIPIVVFIVYYNFIYPSLEKTQKKLLSEQDKKSKELSKIVSDIRKVKNSKHILEPTKQKLELLKEDYKYINYNYQPLKVLQLSDERIYSILTRLLSKSNILNLNTSFDIKWDIQPIPPFNNILQIIIEGQGEYLSIIKYIQFIDHLESLSVIKNIKIALSLKDTDLLQPLLKQTKAESSSVSFILTKYSENTLKYLKSIAKTKNLHISISINPHNINYLDISFRGGYSSIKSVIDILKNISKQKNKIFEFTRLRAKLKYQTHSNKKKTQKFSLTLQIVGVK